LVLAKLQFVNDVFLFGGDFAIGTGIGNTQESVALLLQIGTEPNAIFLGDGAF
jgi:hypothetical protein